MFQGLPEGSFCKHRWIGPAESGPHAATAGELLSMRMAAGGRAARKGAGCGAGVMVGALALGLALPPPIALAQTPPEVGRVLREGAQAPPAAASPALQLPLPPTSQPQAESSPKPGASIVLRSVVFNGNTLYSSDILAAMVADKIGQSVTLADLEDIAGRITRRYRQDGYFLARAVVPGQDVTGGRVEISILEGQLGQVRINRAPEARIGEPVLQGVLGSLEPGKPIHEAKLERVVMLLSDLPGVSVQTSLESGEQPGTSDLIVDVNAGRRWDLSVDADNHGSRFTGEYRVGLLGRVNGPLERGDNLDLRLLSSAARGLTFGRLGYEMPVWYAGTRAGVAVGRLEYELGKDFATLGATGEADVLELNVIHPFIRSRSRNLFGKLSLEDKRLEDRVAAISSVSDKRVRSLGLGLAYEGRDAFFGGGYNSGGGTLYWGDLSIRSPQQIGLDQSAAGRQTDGRFTRMAYQLSRLQVLTQRTNAYLGLAGQLASKNLDSVEKISLGGPRGVRAYPSSEGVADEGHVLTVEYRYSVTPALTVSGFYDAGRAKLNRNPLPGDTDNKLSLRGFGVGLFWGAQYGLTMRASLAWRDTQPSATDLRDRMPRLYVQVIKSF